MSERTQGAVIVCDVNFLFFLGLIPLCLTGPEWGVMWSVLVCSREPFSSATMACCDITGLLTAFLQWKPCLFLELLAWIDSDFFNKKKQTSLMPKLCVSVSVFQHGLWAHGRCYYVMPHVFPVTFSTDSPLLSLQNILTPISTGPPLPSLLCLLAYLISMPTDQKFSCMHVLPLKWWSSSSFFFRNKGFSQACSYKVSSPFPSIHNRLVWKDVEFADMEGEKKPSPEA